MRQREELVHSWRQPARLPRLSAEQAARLLRLGAWTRLHEIEVEMRILRAFLARTAEATARRAPLSAVARQRAVMALQARRAAWKIAS